MSNKKRKQIVFIDPLPNVFMYRLARSLRLTGKYETILFSFSEVNRDFFRKAYDKIFVLELSHKLKIKNIFDFFKKIFRGDVRKFLSKIKKMNPYLFHITGPDLFSLMTLNSLEKKSAPKIYYANDLWSSDTRNYLFTKKFWIKGAVNKFCERKCFNQADGILNKGSLGDFDYLKYNVKTPKMAMLPYCLDEWIFSPKKKGEEIHIAHGGSPNTTGGEIISFMEIIKIFSSQKLYLHTYGSCLKEKDNEMFDKEAKQNKYYFNYEKLTPLKLNESMSKSHYGFFSNFYDKSTTDANPSLLKNILTSRMVNYIEAGLPIILTKQYEYMTEIVEKYGIGFGIDVLDLKNLRKIIEQKDYSQFQRNIKKFQKEFRLSKKIKDIEAFYEKIAETKK